MKVDDLMVAVAQGDDEAFVALHAAVAANIYWAVRKVLRDPDQAAEIEQETLLEIWRLAPRYDPSRGGAMAWIVTVAHHRAVDRVRHEQTFREYTEQRGRDIVEGRASGQIRLEGDPVAEAVEQRHASTRVRTALGELSDLQHAAITLAYYGGYSASEIAELLDVPLGTVKSRLRAGLIRLRRLLEQDWETGR